MWHLPVASLCCWEGKLGWKAIVKMRQALLMWLWQLTPQWVEGPFTPLSCCLPLPDSNIDGISRSAEPPLC